MSQRKSQNLCSKFSTIKNATYKLYRIEEDTCKLLKEYTNTSGKQDIIDAMQKDNVNVIFVIGKANDAIDFIELLDEAYEEIRNRFNNNLP